MKKLIGLIVTLAVIVLAVWGVTGMTPDNQWKWLKGYASAKTDSISEHLSETGESADKLKGVLKTRFDEASDVYHGQDSNETYYQKMEAESK